MALIAPRSTAISETTVKPGALPISGSVGSTHSDPFTRLTSLTMAPASTCWPVVGGRWTSGGLTLLAVKRFPDRKPRVPTIRRLEAPIPERVYRPNFGRKSTVGPIVAHVTSVTQSALKQ